MFPMQTMNNIYSADIDHGDFYGMNLSHMPELNWQLGDFGVLIAMGTLAAAML